MRLRVQSLVELHAHVTRGWAIVDHASHAAAEASLPHSRAGPLRPGPLLPPRTPRAERTRSERWRQRVHFQKRCSRVSKQHIMAQGWSRADMGRWVAESGRGCSDSELAGSV